MDCRQEWHEIQPFIRGQLNGEQTKEFLEHLDQCPSCREELEIYYTIETLVFLCVMVMLLLQFRIW